MSYKDRMVYSSPTPLQGPYGTSWSRGVGQTLDDLLQDYKDAVKVRFPTLAAANNDEQACNRIGLDSSLPRYPAEGLTEYGARLQARWQRYDRAGAAPGPLGGACPILEDLEGIGFGDVELVEYVDWPATSPPANAHASPAPIVDSLGNPWWSRFWLFVGEYDGSPIDPGGTWGTEAWGDARWGFDLDGGVVASAIDAALRWKPAHVLLVSITFLTGGTPFSSVWSGGTWGTASWGGADAGFTVFVNR